MIISSRIRHRTANTSFFLLRTIIGTAAGFILTQRMPNHCQACSEFIEGVDIVEGTFAPIPADLFGQDLQDPYQLTIYDFLLTIDYLISSLRTLYPMW